MVIEIDLIERKKDLCIPKEICKGSRTFYRDRMLQKKFKLLCIFTFGGSNKQVRIKKN